MFIASLIKFNRPFVHSMRKNKNSKRKQKFIPRKKHKRTKITQSRSATINDFPDDILTISPSVESINDFSDEILCHILSFLPINEAFRTTVVCKRWLPLCYSLSELYYDDNVKNHLPQFMNSVMLSPHSQHKTLKSLTLKFHSCSKYLDDTPPDWFTFDIWMEAAKQRNLEKLDIYYLLGIPLVPTIFSCKTLVVLRLTGINVATMFRCSVDLPVLKALYLSDVCFKHMEDFMKLLSGCPKLLDLKTRDVMATTGITTGGCFKPLSKLLHADIGLFEVPLRAVSNVEFLTLTKQWMWESLLDEETNSYYKGYPVFENLTILRLIWYDCDIILEWEYVVVTMLQNCPKLQDLCMSKWWDLTNSKDKDNWEYPDHVPECVSSHLTTCSLLDYHAVEADFRFVTYILQNAKLLQVMEIHYSKNRNSMERPQFIEDLSSYPRISPVCELSIIPR